MRRLTMARAIMLINNDPKLLKAIISASKKSSDKKLFLLSMLCENKQYMEKIANSFRDMVAMGRTPRFDGMNQFQSFNKLRNTGMYPTFEEYSKMNQTKKHLLNQSLVDDLKSIFRKREAFEEFMTKGLGASYNPQKRIWENIGNFNKNQYNRFFGLDKTHYPSLERISKGIIRGLYNRIRVTNNKIRLYNRNNDTSVPRLVIGNGSKQIAPHTNLNVKQIDNILEHEVFGGASFSKGMVGNKNIIIGVNKEPLQTLQREMRKLYNNNNISIDPNKDIRYIQNGTDIAHKAKLLSHEFCEALNEVDFHKKARPIDADIRRWGNDEIFHDSHMSGHVLGNDFLINN